MTELTSSMTRVVEFLQQNSGQFLDELKSFLEIPSISAEPTHKPDMQACAEFVRAQLAGAGLEAQIVPTEGHPIVTGSWQGAEEGPTVLIYGHYDVQPPDPLDEWRSPPFEPTLRDGYIYARGATDDKGQLLTHVKALQAWKQVTGSLPVNVRCVIEGEEEVGSDNLDRFLVEHRDALRCDVAVISDTAQLAPGVPAITYGLRGILACEVKVVGPNQDLHSGVFGGAVANPANALSAMIASLHDDQGRVQIRGFYDDVAELSDDERAALAHLPFDETAFLSELNMDAGWGEAGYSILERRWVRPTCDVNGMISGYTGTGPKTIIPSWASAKLSCRLVPNQSANSLLAALEVHLRDRLPPGLQLEFTSQHGCGGIAVDWNSRPMQAAKAAIERAFGVAPVMIREGGSIPVVSTFRDLLGIDTLLLGWGQSTDNLHSPNERFRLEDFHHGTLASAYLWDELARSYPPSVS